ncbi:hypothetical protein CYPRO_1725 [Cyclonatronum proteinivorum]|uniref:Uncharacterized protein n=1 Tax=Cyclonatronum proteinivorum TaxID=1457365 RepID=A0A345UKH4_9BACT|nr:hypothetical protein CYPRO_1725 [Cyclonatronum proteinivorum]
MIYTEFSEVKGALATESVHILICQKKIKGLRLEVCLIIIAHITIFCKKGLLDSSLMIRLMGDSSQEKKRQLRILRVWFSSSK